MNSNRILIFCAVVASLSGLPGQANAKQATQSPPGSKISLAPLPVEIFKQPGQKPAIAFSTPCIQIEIMTHGFPPFLAFENFMLDMIGKVNDSEALPVRLEPVCF
jgi:hypothetical protein